MTIEDPIEQEEKIKEILENGDEYEMQIEIDEDGKQDFRVNEFERKKLHIYS